MTKERFSKLLFGEDMSGCENGVCTPLANKLALRLHPDKNPNDEDAKEKFQQLRKVISILGDEEKRTLYDQTGCVDDAELAGDVIQNLKDFFRTMLQKLILKNLSGITEDPSLRRII